MSFKTLVRTGLIAGAVISAVVAAQATDISGAGATFPYPIYSKWAAAYKTETGDSLNYQSIGSGGGIKQIEARLVTFGATDKPLDSADLEKNGLVQWPQVLGGIVPVINLDGIDPGALVLDGPTLASIFLGNIKTWDDPAIAKLNPGVKLPSTAIVVVHRADGSGTTFNFTDYLSKVSPDWKAKVGSATAVQWPTGVGAKGNEGVANNVVQSKGAIGYLEYAYALQNKLTYTKLINSAGKVVAPAKESFAAAASSADWAHAPGFKVILTNQPGDASWPLTAATFILLPKQPKDIDAAKAALKFFAWAFDKGGPAAESLDYIPIPAPVVTLIKKTWADEIKDTDGKALLN